MHGAVFSLGGDLGVKTTLLGCAGGAEEGRSQGWRTSARVSDGLRPYSSRTHAQLGLLNTTVPHCALQAGGRGRPSMLARYGQGDWRLRAGANLSSGSNLHPAFLQTTETTQSLLSAPQVGGRGGPSGLAHISQVSDDFVRDIHAAFHAGQGAMVAGSKTAAALNSKQSTVQAGGRIPPVRPAAATPAAQP